MRVPLGNDLFALIDEEDRHLLRYRYYLNSWPTGRFVVCRKDTRGPINPSGRRNHRLLAHDVLNLPRGSRVWYLNGNHLDCRRSNLRAQIGTISHSPEGHPRKPYRAMIRINRVRFDLGYWPTEEWARIACETGHEAAKEIRGKGLGPAQIKRQLRAAVGID